MERASGVTLLSDLETARPRCMAEVGYLSAARTSAYSVLSVDDADLIRDNPQRILGHLLNEEPATYVTAPSVRYSTGPVRLCGPRADTW